ncbi:MAG TPA: extracellular solute-binding protein [Thermoleophilia bacterium]|nr:extracellular solute-binding protein [Thermoleophilia bacterium]
MRHTRSPKQGRGPVSWLLALVVLAALVVVAAACGSSNSGGSTSPSASASAAVGVLPSPTPGTSITIDYHYPSPPKSVLAQFTKLTGVKVNWVEVGWDNLQTKIAAAATSNTYFADLTDVDWSKVGQYYKTKWFMPLNQYFDVASLKSDMPQIDTFASNNQQLALPFDSSFTVTTLNTKIAKAAGAPTAPTTMTDYTNALNTIKAKGTVPNPLDIPFAAAEGLSTYWYQATAAFGGQVLDASYNPQFTSPSSGGYKAMQWMVNAYKSGLVPKANIGVSDYQGFTSEMAQGRVASVFSDYAGTVGSVYDVPSSSKVVGQVQYIPTPGVSGAAPNLANPDGIGIPVTAKNVAGALAFIKWFTDTQQQAIWAGLNGPSDVISGFPLPARVSSLQLLTGKVAGAAELTGLLKTSRAEFPGPGAPPWYSQFSNSVYTNIHQAAAGSQTVQQAVTNIANQVTQLKASQ